MTREIYELGCSYIEGEDANIWRPKAASITWSCVSSKSDDSLPQVQWENPDWGVLREQTWAMEINFDEEGPVESFMLHVRGSGDPHITVAKLCRDNGWVAFDMTTGEHLDLANPSDAGWRSFLGAHQKVARRVKWEEKLEEYRLLIFAIIVGFVIALYRFFK